MIDLVPDWKSWPKWFSTWAAVLLAGLAAFPEAMLMALSWLPEELQAYVRWPVWVVLVVAFVGLRLWKQGRKP